MRRNAILSAGETDKLVELLLEGYDHILDAEDYGVNITDVAAQRKHEATEQFLQSIPNYVVRRRNQRDIRIKSPRSVRAHHFLDKILILYFALSCRPIIKD